MHMKFTVLYNILIMDMGNILMHIKGKEVWDENKAMGEAKFIVYAVLLYVGSMFIEISIFTIFFNSNTMFRMTDYSVITIVFILIACAIILGVVGILLGIHIWNTQTREFDNK